MILNGGSKGPIASRFIGGELISDLVQTIKSLKEEGYLASTGVLQDSLVSAGDFGSVVERYKEAIKASGVFEFGSTVTVKLSSLGSVSDPVSARERLARLFDEGAAQGGIFLRIEMESPRFVQETLNNVQQMQQFYPHLGAVIQANLRRSDRDLEALVSAGISIRLVKGAYPETPPTGYSSPSDIDAAYRRHMFALLDSGNFHSIATHDEKMIETAVRYMNQRNMPKDACEFEMYMGVKPRVAAQLLKKGYRVRIYAPFGHSWYPYVAQRVAEGGVKDFMGSFFKR